MVFGEGETARAWAADLLHTVKHDGYDAMWTRLVEWRAGVCGESRIKAADALLHYVSERKAMLHYDWALAHGWQIGSGPTEAQCKTTTRRIKGSGWADTFCASSSAILTNISFMTRARTPSSLT